MRILPKEKLYDKVVDAQMPSLKELKRVLLIALRCLDPDVKNRPRMGDVIHMLEPRDLLVTDAECCISHKISRVGCSLYFGKASGVMYLVRAYEARVVSTVEAKLLKPILIEVKSEIQGIANSREWWRATRF